MLSFLRLNDLNNAECLPESSSDVDYTADFALSYKDESYARQSQCPEEDLVDITNYSKS